MALHVAKFGEVPPIKPQFKVEAAEEEAKKEENSVSPDAQLKLEDEDEEEIVAVDLEKLSLRDKVGANRALISPELFLF